MKQEEIREIVKKLKSTKTELELQWYDQCPPELEKKIDRAVMKLSGTIKELEQEEWDMLLDKMRKGKSFETEEGK